MKEKELIDEYYRTNNPELIQGLIQSYQNIPVSQIEDNLNKYILPKTQHADLRFKILISLIPASESAFELFYKHSLPLVIKFSKPYFKSAEDLEEFIQEFYIHFLDQKEKFNYRYRFTTWFVECIRNLASTTYRNKYRTIKNGGGKIYSLNEIMEDNPGFEIAVEPHDFIRLERKGIVLKIIQTIKHKKMREIGLLRYGEGLEYREIAKRLGISTKSVDNYLYDLNIRICEAILRDYNNEDF